MLQEKSLFVQRIFAGFERLLGKLRDVAHRGWRTPMFQQGSIGQFRLASCRNNHRPSRREFRGRECRRGDRPQFFGHLYGAFEQTLWLDDFIYEAAG